MPSFPKRPQPLLLLALAALALAGCNNNPLLVKRSPCPAVALPVYTNTVTLFRPNTAPDTNNVDLTAVITNVRTNCSEAEAIISGTATYDVIARRTDTAEARSVTFPVFASIVQGGDLIVSKQLGQVTLDFSAGQALAQSRNTVYGRVDREAASLDAETQKIINRKRKPGDPDAAVDPLADPQVRAAMRAASFEVLIGFQLSDAQLAYNVTK